jgi:hypothetical protein
MPLGGFLGCFVDPLNVVNVFDVGLISTTFAFPVSSAWRAALTTGSSIPSQCAIGAVDPNSNAKGIAAIAVKQPGLPGTSRAPEPPNDV